MREDWSRWWALARLGPRLAFTALRRGLLPAGAAAFSTLRAEGIAALHWKVLGDALVRFLQHSGPVLTKLGQILATRSDLLPEAVCLRLEALYDGQPPMAASRLRRLLARAYPRGAPFAQFERRPLAVGSVGQVHRARLEDGSRVIVKLARPGVLRALGRDLKALRALVELLFRLSPRARPAARDAALAALDDLGAALTAEIDLRNEARALEGFRERLQRNPRVAVPLCHRALSSRRVLVLEELPGIPFAALRERSGTNPGEARRAASLAFREILSQIFEDGRFHADPHGGNLLLLPDGRLGLIDLGLTGELSKRDRRNIARAARAFLARDADASLRILLEFGETPPDFDLELFRKDLGEVFRERRGGVVAHLTGGDGGAGAGAPSLEEVVGELFQVARRHGIRLPPSTVLLIKTVVTIEGVARALDPELDAVVAALPVVLRSLAPRWLRWGRRR